MSSSSSDEETAVVALALAAEEDDRVSRKQRRIWVHRFNALRDTEGEYHTLFPRLKNDNVRFFRYFRMSYEKFMELLHIIEPAIEKRDTNFRRSISPEERLAVTLRFLGHAGTYRSVAFSYRMGESTVADIVHSTCKAIWEKLSPVVMAKPDKNKFEMISETFNERWQYPNAIGAIDRKHVVIEKPGNSGSMYFNYKKGFSIVLLALVDANCNFITVDVGAYGKNSDGGIFKESQIGKSLHDGLLDLPPPKALGSSSIVLPYVMLADEAFPLHTNIMRPFPGPQLINDKENKIYNYRHCRCRRVVESGFGILAKKFRVYSQKLQVNPDHVDIIVLATTCLHNYLRGDDVNLWRPGELERNEEFHGLQPLRRSGGNAALEAFDIRDGFKKYFNSVHGKVSWQDDMINKGRKDV